MIVQAHPVPIPSLSRVLWAWLTSRLAPLAATQLATSMATCKRRCRAWRWRACWQRMMGTLSGLAATQ